MIVKAKDVEIGTCYIEINQVTKEPKGHPCYRIACVIPDDNISAVNAGQPGDIFWSTPKETSVFIYSDGY